MPSYIMLRKRSLWYICVVLSTIISENTILRGNKRCHNRIKKMRLREARGYEARPRRIFSTESKIERSIRLVYLAYQTCREKLVRENFRGEIFSNEIFNWTVTATTCDARFFLLFFSFSSSFFALSLCAREILSLVIFQVWTIDGDHGGW